MTDKFYSYSDASGDEVNIRHDQEGTAIHTDDTITIPPEELPKLIAVLQSHLEEPTDDRPWFIVSTDCNLIGPFTSEADARKKASRSDLIRQVNRPEPDIDHEWAGNWARSLTKDTESTQDQNLARAYLELSAKQ